MSHEEVTLGLAATIAPIVGWGAETTVEAARTFQAFIRSQDDRHKAQRALTISVNIAAKAWAAFPVSDRTAEEMVKSAKEFLVYLCESKSYPREAVM